MLASDQEDLEKGPILSMDVRHGLECFCGLRFGARGAFDEHLKETHPWALARCADCDRPLPKGSWRKSGEGRNLLVLVLDKDVGETGPIPP